MNASTVASRISAILQLSNDFNEAVQRGKVNTTEQIVSDFSDETKRFCLWSVNVGAHDQGTGSLEYRLRDSSNILSTIISLLDQLSLSLQDAISIVSGSITPWNDAADTDDLTVEDDNELKDIMPKTELEEICVNMRVLISSLLRLSMAIRNPTQHDYLKAPLATHTSSFAASDLSYVWSKFPGSKPWLVERLGRSLTRRRQYFEYRRSHQARFAAESSESKSLSEARADIHAASILGEPGDISESGIISSSPLMSAEDHVPQASFASSTNDAAAVRVPPPPPPTDDDGPRECPFCYGFISILDMFSWE